MDVRGADAQQVAVWVARNLTDEEVFGLLYGERDSEHPLHTWPEVPSPEDLPRMAAAVDGRVRAALEAVRDSFRGLQVLRLVWWDEVLTG